MQKFDIAIIGAGLNGLVAALALGGRHAKQPLSVVVIDRFDPRRFVGGGQDSRASALTQATQTMFDVLGLWQAIAPHAQNMEKIIVTDSKLGEPRPSLLSFAQGDDQHAAAAMVENHFIYESLLREIDKSPEIQLLTQTNISDIQYGPWLAQIHLSSEQLIKASLVVGADGRNSLARSKADLDMRGWDYAQSAITLTVEHELPHGGEAEEHFTPNGVFAILPLTSNRSSLVWTEKHEEALRLHSLSDENFLLELSRRVGDHRGALKLGSARHVHPLSLGLATASIGQRLALIGDAAHVVHPLAGLGLNLGFKDAASLADCVMDGVRMGQDIGSSFVLEHYARSRHFDTVSTVYGLDAMNKLFSNDNSALKFLRDLGLQAVDKVPQLKSALMREAAGQAGDLPRLMRGLAA